MRVRGGGGVAGEEVPERGGEGHGGGARGQGGAGEVAAEGDEDGRVVDGLAGRDLLAEQGAVLQLGAGAGLGGGLAGAGGAEAGGGVAAGGEEGGHEGEVDDVDGRVGAELEQAEWRGGRTLAVVDGDVVGGEWIKGAFGGVRR